MARKLITLLIALSFAFPPGTFAQVSALPVPGNGFVQQAAADRFRPVHLRYLSYQSANGRLDLLLDKEKTSQLSEDALRKTTGELLDYFLIGLNLPDSDFWVNLRPDSPDRMIADDLARTDVGRIMLEADLQLKKDTARHTSPATKEGREYWDKVWRKAEELYGDGKITVPTLTRPWIVPDEIIVRESGGSAYVYKATLKVMLEQDRLKGDTRYAFADGKAKELNAYSSELIRKTIIPLLNSEINSSRRYAPLRQVFYSLILAQWFKHKFIGGAGGYARRIDRKDLTGLTSKTAWDKSAYFTAYRKSFSDGEYNLNEQTFSSSGRTMRNFVSGGITFAAPLKVVPGGGGLSPAVMSRYSAVTVYADGGLGFPREQKAAVPEDDNILRGSSLDAHITFLTVSHYKWNEEQEYKDILDAAVYVFGAYEQYLTADGLAAKKYFDGLAQQARGKDFSWERNFKEFVDRAQIIPRVTADVRDLHLELFRDILEGESEERLKAFCNLGYGSQKDDKYARTHLLTLNLSEGCSNQCIFCGERQLQKVKYGKKMPLPVAIKLLQGLPSAQKGWTMIVPYAESDPLDYYDEISGATIADFVLLASRVGFGSMSIVTHGSNARRKEMAETLKALTRWVSITISLHVFHYDVKKYALDTLDPRNDRQELDRKREEIVRRYVQRFLDMLWATQGEVDIRLFNCGDFLTYVNQIIQEEEGGGRGHSMTRKWRPLDARELAALKRAERAVAEMQGVQDEVWKRLEKLFPFQKRHAVEKHNVVWIGAAAGMLASLGVPADIIADIQESIGQRGNLYVKSFEPYIDTDGSLLALASEDQVSLVRTVRETFPDPDAKEFKWFLRFVKAMLEAKMKDFEIYKDQDPVEMTDREFKRYLLERCRAIQKIKSFTFSQGEKERYMEADHVRVEDFRVRHPYLGCFDSFLTLSFPEARQMILSLDESSPVSDIRARQIYSFILDLPLPALTEFSVAVMPPGTETAKMEKVKYGFASAQNYTIMKRDVFQTSRRFSITPGGIGYVPLKDGGRSKEKFPALAARISWNAGYPLPAGFSKLIQQTVSWERKAHRGKGRSGIIFLGRPVSFNIKGRTVVVKAVKIKGMGEFVDGTALPPVAQKYETSAGFHMRADENGSLFPVSPEPTPAGGLSFRRARNEYDLLNKILNESDIGVNIPLGYGEYPEMSFNGDHLGFVIEGLTDIRDARFDDILKERGDPAGYLLSCYRNWGKTLRRLNDLGILHLRTHSGNWSASEDGTVTVHDLDSAVLKGQLDAKAAFMMQLMPELAGAIRDIHSDTAVFPSARRIIEQGGNPYRAFLEGYFGKEAADGDPQIKGLCEALIPVSKRPANLSEFATQRYLVSEDATRALNLPLSRALNVPPVFDEKQLEAQMQDLRGRITGFEKDFAHGTAKDGGGIFGWLRGKKGETDERNYNFVRSYVGDTGKPTPFDYVFQAMGEINSLLDSGRDVSAQVAVLNQRIYYDKGIPFLNKMQLIAVVTNLFSKDQAKVAKAINNLHLALVGTGYIAVTIPRLDSYVIAKQMGESISTELPHSGRLTVSICKMLTYKDGEGFAGGLLLGEGSGRRIFLFDLSENAMIHEMGHAVALGNEGPGAEVNGERVAKLSELLDDNSNVESLLGMINDLETTRTNRRVVHDIADEENLKALWEIKTGEKMPAFSLIEVKKGLRGISNLEIANLAATALMIGHFFPMGKEFAFLEDIELCVKRAKKFGEGIMSIVLKPRYERNDALGYGERDLYTLYPYLLSLKAARSGDRAEGVRRIREALSRIYANQGISGDPVSGLGIPEASDTDFVVKLDKLIELARQEQVPLGAGLHLASWAQEMKAGDVRSAFKDGGRFGENILVLNPSALSKLSAAEVCVFDWDETLSYARGMWPSVFGGILAEAMGDAGRTDEMAVFSRNNAGLGDSNFALLFLDKFSAGHAADICRWLGERGLPLREADLVRPGARQKAADLIADEYNRRIAIAVEQATKERGYPPVYPGATEFLAGLRAAGKTLFVATAGMRQFSWEIVDSCRLGFRESDVYGAEPGQVGFSKGKVLAALAKGRVTVMFGDAAADMRAAREAGAIAIGVAHTPEAENILMSQPEGQRPDMIIGGFKQPGELLGLFSAASKDGGNPGAKGGVD
ncbi:MAG: HAD family hydrolase, partial [Deltaproteobacteria bacterium]